MSQKSARQSYIADEDTPTVLVAALRHWHPDLSWSKVRQLLRSRRVAVGDVMSIDESRKLRPGDRIDVFDQSLPHPPGADQVTVHYVDRDVVVVEKPPRMVTERHKRERSWPASKKRLQPTLEEVIPDVIYREGRDQRPAVLSVHRIDRDTSGLLVFARHNDAKEALVAQFAAHDIVRVYGAVVVGRPAAQTVRNKLIRDRGDGLRGSTSKPHGGKEAATHIRPLRSYRGIDGLDYTEIECQLETGRTHQIRIHLAELGHPVCGDPSYRGSVETAAIPDTSGAPRVALHARELGFTHPKTQEAMHFTSPWPSDMLRFLTRLDVANASETNTGEDMAGKKSGSEKHPS